jgi:hypothetical protein
VSLEKPLCNYCLRNRNCIVGVWLVTNPSLPLTHIFLLFAELDFNFCKKKKEKRKIQQLKKTDYPVNNRFKTTG